MYTCKICGKDVSVQHVVDNKGLFCIDCFRKLRTCAGCKHNSCTYQKCGHPQKWIGGRGFFNNPIPNPNLVKEICTGEAPGTTKCICCSNDLKGCNKPNGICDKYEEIELK